MNPRRSDVEPEILAQMSIIDTNTDEQADPVFAEEERDEGERTRLALMNPRDRQQHFNAKFFTGLIREGQQYADKLEPIAQHNYRATGIDVRFQSVPQELVGYVPGNTGYNLQGLLSLDFETSKKTALNLTKFKFQMEDGPEIEIASDPPSTSLLVNGEVAARYMGSGLAEAMLRSLLPGGAPAIGAAALAFALHSLGTYRLHTMKAGNQDAKFAFTSEVTIDSSRHVLEVDASLPEHRSGKTIVLKASIIQDSYPADKSVNSRGALKLSAITTPDSSDAPLYVDQIVNQEPVSVERPTEVHREIIKTALEELEYIAAKQTGKTGQSGN